MGSPVQLDKWFREARSLATLVPADGLFSLLRRTLDLPSAFAALARRKDGRAVLTSAGGKLSGEDLDDVLIVRATPWELAWEFSQLAAKDKYLCNARVTISLSALVERAELEALRDRIMGSRSRIELTDVQRYLAPFIERGLRALVAAHDADSLAEGEHAAAAREAVADALREPCFSSGLLLASEPVVVIDSPAVLRTREAEQRAARALDEHEALSALRTAQAEAQQAHLAHLDAMLTRLHELAQRSPTVELPELMHSFDESQRGQLYQALFSSRARRRLTQWIAVTAGYDVHFFDAHAPADSVRRVTLDGPAGPLRSIQYDAAADRLLIGAARGVYILPTGASVAEAVFLVGEDRSVRGGFNAVALRGDDVVATHSERGVVHWRQGETTEGRPIQRDVAAGASAVRNAQFAGDRCWFTVDSGIYSVPANKLDSTPAGRCIDHHLSISALLVTDAHVYVGCSDGKLFVANSDITAPRLLHSGSRRPVESLALVLSGGIARLFFTDTSLAVYARVIGDTFACRYEASGQVIRRAECAADIIAATTDARDRVLIWRADEPEHPASVVNVLRLSGHSVQDVCLVPT